LYTVPASTKATATVSFCNRTGNSLTVRLAVCGVSDIPGNADFVFYDFPLSAASSGAGATLERKGIALDAGQKIVVYASAIGVSVQAYGITSPV